MELDQFMPLLADSLQEKDLKANEDFKNFLRDPSLCKIREFSDMLVMSLPSPRIDWYSSSNYDAV